MKADILRQITDKTLAHGGVTYDIVHGRELAPIDAWFYPAYPGLTAIVPTHELPDALDKFMVQHKDLFEPNKHYLGTWIHPKTGLVYIDITTYHPDKNTALAEAKRLGEQQNRPIKSIYNPTRSQTLPLSTPSKA